MPAQTEKDRQLAQRTSDRRMLSPDSDGDQPIGSPAKGLNLDQPHNGTRRDSTGQGKLDLSLEANSQYSGDLKIIEDLDSE